MLCASLLVVQYTETLFKLLCINGLNYYKISIKLLAHYVD